MKYKRIFLCAVIISAMLTGCGPNGESSVREEPTVSAETTATEPVSTGSFGKESSAVATTAENTEALNEERTVSADLSDSGAGHVQSAALHGVFSSDTEIEDIYGMNVLHDGVAGRFGAPVMITSVDLESATLAFKYDPDDMGNVPEKNLFILRYDEDRKEYIELPPTLNTEKHTVSTRIKEPGVYMLADMYEWYKAWGYDMSEYEHDVVLQNDDFGFRITVPTGISTNSYYGLVPQEDSDGRFITVLDEYNDVNDIGMGISCLERPNETSAESFLGKIAEALTVQSYEPSERGSLTTDSGEVGTYFYIDFGTNMFIKCFFELDSTHYIDVSFSFVDEEKYDEAMSSLKSFEFFDKHIPPELTSDG